MGKGDKKSRRGKIWKGSYGNSRRRRPEEAPKETPKKATK
jgi:30S ribosomal protein S31